MLESQYYHKWAELLNSQCLRNNLITTSNYLLAYESLKNSVIINPICNFFCYEFDKKGELIHSEDYKDKVLSKHKKQFIASVLWLKEEFIINNNDYEVILDNLRPHRNRLAHNLHELIMGGDPNINSLAEENMSRIKIISELVKKIEFWWIKEVSPVKMT